MWHTRRGCAILRRMPRQVRTKTPRARIKKIALAFPDATAREIEHIKFEVRGKTFAYFLDNHHGDGRLAINCKVARGDQDLLLRLDPERFFMPAYIGSKVGSVSAWTPATSIGIRCGNSSLTAIASLPRAAR